MFYIGIDIGKRHHEAGLINDKGHPVGKTTRFDNSKPGSKNLLAFINQHNLTPDNTVVGLEATGHYWLSVFSFLHKLGFKTTVFNPLQSDALRHFHTRKAKTDVKDAYLIAQVIRIDSPDETPFLEEDLLKLRHLERLRFSLSINLRILNAKLFLYSIRFFQSMKRYFQTYLVSHPPKSCCILFFQNTC